MGADIDVQNGKNCDYVEALQKYLLENLKKAPMHTHIAHAANFFFFFQFNSMF